MCTYYQCGLVGQSYLLVLLQAFGAGVPYTVHLAVDFVAMYGLHVLGYVLQGSVPVSKSSLTRLGEHVESRQKSTGEISSQHSAMEGKLYRWGIMLFK